MKGTVRDRKIWLYLKGGGKRDISRYTELREGHPSSPFFLPGTHQSLVESITSPEKGYIWSHKNLISSVKSHANHHHQVAWHSGDTSDIQEVPGSTIRRVKSMLQNKIIKQTTESGYVG